MQQIVRPSKVVSFESTHLRFCPRLLWAMKSLVSSANQKAVASCRVVGWLYFPPMFFFPLSSLTNATGCIAGTCAETVVKRTVRHEGKYCPCRGSEDR